MQSYRLIHQIFFENNKFDDPISIDKIDEFVYDKNRKYIEIIEPNIQKIQEKKERKIFEEKKERKIFEEKKETKEILKKQIQKSKDTFYEPAYTTDTIFWCIFQHVYGDREIQHVGQRFGNRMMEEKQKILEKLQKNPKILKESNVRFTNDRMNEVMSELMCARGESSFLILAAYSIYYDIDIYLVDEEKKTFLKFLPSKSVPVKIEEKVCVLYKNPHSKSAKSKYRKKCVSDKTELDNLKLYCELVQFDKPVCGQSTYGVNDLEEMANKLSIPLLSADGKRLKKPELYKIIWEKMEWTM